MLGVLYGFWLCKIYVSGFARLLNFIANIYVEGFLGDFGMLTYLMLPKKTLDLKAPTLLAY